MSEVYGSLEESGSEAEISSDGCPVVLQWRCIVHRVYDVPSPGEHKVIEPPTRDQVGLWAHEAQHIAATPENCLAIAVASYQQADAMMAVRRGIALPPPKRLP